MSNGNDTTYDCVVLGAGIAGVTAARDLHRLGCSVVVLEGAPRVGGRIFTRHNFVQHPDFAAQASRYPIESGAEYVHVGRKGRYAAFYDEIDNLGFTTTKFSKVYRNRLAFTRDWLKNLQKLVIALLTRPELLPTIALLPAIEKYKRSSDTPVGRYIAGKDIFVGKGEALARYSLSSHTPGILYDPDVDRCRLDPQDAVLDTISVAGIRYDQLPDQLFSEKSERRLEKVIGPRSEICGYDSFPQAIATQIEQPNGDGNRGEILLQHRVTKVERTNGGIAVTVVEPGGAMRTINARSAISTFSVGVLDPVSGHGDSVFGPLLTDDKRDALKSIRMGPITKFSLEFKKSHWGRGAKMSVMSYPRGCARTFFSAFPRVEGRPKGPFVLSGLLMGRDHRIIEGMSDEAAIQHLLDVLQTVFAPRKNRWRPEDVLVGTGSGVGFAPNYLRKDWAADGFALGGNSFISYSDQVDSAGVSTLRERLKSPLETLPLFWAGEATAPAYDSGYQPLSVHGAFISGKGAAADVKAYLDMGLDSTSLRSYYDDRYTAPRLATLVEPPPAATRVRLTDNELALVERYATENESSVEEATEEIYQIGYYAQQHVRSALAMVDGNNEVQLALEAGDLERLRQLAVEMGMPVADTAEALLRRGIDTLRKARQKAQP